MPESATGEGITITRVFDAPRHLVYKAWTEPERFARLFGDGGPQTTLRLAESRPVGPDSVVVLTYQPARERERPSGSR